MDSNIDKLKALAQRATLGGYHAFMAMLGAHPKTTAILCFVAGGAVGHSV